MVRPSANIAVTYIALNISCYIIPRVTRLEQRSGLAGAGVSARELDVGLSNKLRAQVVYVKDYNPVIIE